MQDTPDSLVPKDFKGLRVLLDLKVDLENLVLLDSPVRLDHLDSQETKETKDYR